MVRKNYDLKTLKTMHMTIRNRIEWMAVWAGFIILLMLSGCQPVPKQTGPGLKDAFDGQFLIGTALNTKQTTGTDQQLVNLIDRHFNAVVAENCMKSENLQPRPGRFTFDDADQFVKFGEQHHLFVTGHCLVWHSQAPRWFFTDENNQDVTREVLIERMKNHITTVVGRYKGRVKGWDVVNEAIEDNGDWRKNKFYRIIGEDYLQIAFEAAHAADPEAELYYNDYNMFKEGKRNKVVELVKAFKEKGIPIDGLGMQGHYTLDSPTLGEVEASLAAFSGLGVKVMFTELDITVLPMPTPELTADISKNADMKNGLDPYKSGLPEDVRAAQTQRYLDLFNLFLKYKEHIARITFWGVNDKQSWKNNFPVRGRTDYALIFDRKNQPKPVVDKLIEAGMNSKNK